MAWPTKPGNVANQFKPGQSGNLNGRPPIPEDLKQTKQLTKTELERLINLHIHSDQEQLRKVIADPKAPVIEVFICKILFMGIGQGDQARFNFILERLIGKVPDRVNVENTVTLITIDSSQANKLIEQDHFNKPIEVEYSEVQTPTRD